MSYIEDTKRTQKISEETVQHLRDLKDQKISTGRIAARAVEILREEWAHKFAYLENKSAELDIEVKKQGGLLGKIWRGINGIVK